MPTDVALIINSFFGVSTRTAFRNFEKYINLFNSIFSFTKLNLRSAEDIAEDLAEEEELCDNDNDDINNIVDNEEILI